MFSSMMVDYISHKMVDFVFQSDVKRQTVRRFERYNESFLIVKNYFEGLEYTNISITNEGRMYVSQYGKTISIKDEKAEEAIEFLRRKGYRFVGKRAGVIYFGKQVGIRDCSRGVAYSINGSTPDGDAIQFLTRIEPMEKEGWFFYEDDYDEWRIRR
jgi:hypothetical protein